MRDRRRYRLLTALALVVALVGGTFGRVAHAQGCQFVLGFATLHALIPQIRGIVRGERAPQSCAWRWPAADDKWLAGLAQGG